ncbi:trypsin-like peptidase domain-containing protein [Candidatus Kaiserbacteria bacterium]|nr:trypsin-like peptidase domain-containing protein [Candidatus Kaiserbacteria bacterium]
MDKRIAQWGIAALLLIAPAAALASIDTNLRYGARGEAVTQLQQFLGVRGFLESEPTGNFYSLTLKAVKAYQSSQGIPATGFVGPLTRAAINQALAAESEQTPNAAAASDAEYQKLMIPVEQLLKALSNDTFATNPSAPAPATSTPAQFAFDPAWRDAIVNLYCLSRYGTLDDATSGSGVIIDPRGVILTNAHVASSFIFADWPNPNLLDCSVRIGSPAAPRYKAALLYIPDAYMTDRIARSYTYTDDTPVYGEKDYALLIITGPTNSAASMPNSFPHLDLYQGGPLPVGTPVYLSGYSAEFLGGIALQRDLSQLSSASIVASQAPIGNSATPEAIAFTGNISSQHGASGGAVIGAGGKLAGLVTFLNKDYGISTKERVLNAITTDYILRDFAADHHTMSIAAFLNSTTNLTDLARTYASSTVTRYQQMYAKIWKDRGFNVPGLP